MLALVFADALRREVIRDYGDVYKHPAPIYAPVCGADTGGVYALLPSWRFWDQEDERHAAMMHKGSHIVGSKGHMSVRIFKTPEEAVVFFGNENASPLRMHLTSSPRQGIFKSKSFGQLGNGGSIMSSRDDGWDLRDSDGRYRY